MVQPPPATWAPEGPWIRRQELAGDASTRSYARLWENPQRSAILVRYPPGGEAALTRDLDVLRWCTAAGLRVPRVIDRRIDQRWAIVEDLGPSDAESTLASCDYPDRCGIVAALLEPLVTLARLDPRLLPRWNPPLNAARLRWELAGFELWFLRHSCGIRPDPQLSAWLDHVACEAASHPCRVCHRDYHLNNLFVLPSGEVALIDVQDLLVGPDTYDAVSLLGDRSARRLLDRDEREAAATAWAARTRAAPGWRERWSVVRCQRALKVLGTFARLDASGRPQYRRWMGELSASLVDEADSLALPTTLTAVLLDWCGLGGHDVR